MAVLYNILRCHSPRLSRNVGLFNQFDDDGKVGRRNLLMRINHHWGVLPKARVIAAVPSRPRPLPLSGFVAM